MPGGPCSSTLTSGVRVDERTWSTNSSLERRISCGANLGHGHTDLCISDTHLDDGAEVDDPVLDDTLELLLRDTECGLDLVERVHEVLALHVQVLDVVRDARGRADLDVTQERERGRALDEPANLRAR